MDLQAGLPALLPQAIAWAEEEAARAAVSGRPPTSAELAMARAVGVRATECIRIQLCEQLPLPQDLVLQAAAIHAGLLGPNMIGLTLGYSIFVRNGHETARLLAHEFRHVYQVEQCGSLSDFLQIYLQQIVTVGYENAPFEIDARAHEVAAS